MSKKLPAKLSYEQRFDAEAQAQLRRYCDVFKQWQSCRMPRCGRARACRGEARACLAAALARVPRARQWRARQDILEATAVNFGRPEREARMLMPRELWEKTQPPDPFTWVKKLEQRRAEAPAATPRAKRREQAPTEEGVWQAWPFENEVTDGSDGF